MAPRGRDPEALLPISNLLVAYTCTKFKIVRIKIGLSLGFKLKYYIGTTSSIFRYCKVVKVKHYIMLVKCHAHLHILLKLVKN